VEYTPTEEGVHKVSISPLELVTQAFAVRAVRQQTQDTPANGGFYSRCDNLSAVQVVAAGRARSPAMAEALRVVREEGALGAHRHLGQQGS
jgi:hypothetical protein